MTVDRIWHILGKKLSGEATASELTELDQLLRQHPELYYPIQNISDLWRLGKPVDGYEARQALRKHLLRLGEIESDTVTIEDTSYETNNIAEPLAITAITSYKRRNSVVAGALAIAAVFILAYIFLPSLLSPAKPTATGSLAHSAERRDKNEVSTRYGSRSKIVLPDGSTVWLNAGSQLEYDKNFDKEIREVSLNGEAYFDVTRDTNRPFIIHTQKINIKVLGTAFNVKSYTGDTHSETSLIHGSIEVTMKDNPEEKIIMKPAEKLVVMNDAKHLSGPANSATANSIPPVILGKINYIPTDGTVEETSWMDNRLVFREKTFEELAMELERKYGLPIRFENATSRQLMFDGNFKNETINQAMEALQLANHFNYTIVRDTVIITK